MVSVAEFAREQGLVPGGVFWITADGNKEKVLSSFADFMQSVEKCALPEQDKRCTRAVVCRLGQALGRREGRWLLCVDNADSGDAVEIVGEVAKVTGRNGWLVVTSRRGSRGLWAGV